MQQDVIQTLSFLSEEQRQVLRDQDLTTSEDFAHITVERLERPPFNLSAGKASRLLRAAGVPAAGVAPATSNVTVTLAEPPDLAARIDRALAAALDDPSKAGALDDLGVRRVVLAATDKIDPAATLAMRAHEATGATVGRTWQGQRVVDTLKLSTPPLWCSPRTGKPLQAGADEVSGVRWGELGLDGLRVAAFGYEEGLFEGRAEDDVLEAMRRNTPIKDRVIARMCALEVKPEAMDRIVVFIGHRASPAAQTPARAHGPLRNGTRPLIVALADLFLTLFSADELRRFLRHLPDGDRIIGAMPGANASPTSLASEAAVFLHRQGCVDRDLRDRITAERPRRVSDIARVFDAAGI